jgi:hypothetical protein
MRYGCLLLPELATFCPWRWIHDELKANTQERSSDSSGCYRKGKFSDRVRMSSLA